METKDRYRGKKYLDIFISSFLLITLSPILLLTALSIKIFDGSPVFYKKRAVGFGGKYFLMLKFRSMIKDAEKQEEEIYGIFRKAGRRLENDPRVTRIGRIIRKLSLDELPQFINVLRGEMSLVGPRPKSLWQLKLFSNNIRAIYLSSQPGITGLSQITCRSVFNKSLFEALEKSYFENSSFWLDCEIILKTVQSVLSCRGAC